MAHLTLNKQARGPAWLAALVIKDGVAIGGLTEAERAAALALVWAGLSSAATFSEAALNAVLKAQLAGAASCLHTDHVELRRWMVDMGFLRRDGYGRCYQQTTLHELPPSARQGADSVLAACADQGVAAWVDTQRADCTAQRAARRSAWQARQSA